MSFDLEHKNNRITKVIISSVVKRGKFDAPNMVYKATYESKSDSWEGAGSLFQIFQVGSTLIAQKINGVPIITAANVQEMMQKISLHTNCNNVEFKK